MKKTREQLNLRPKLFPGEVGELYAVRYIPSYMKDWPYWKVKLGCFLLNHLPKRVANWMEDVLW